MAVETVVKSGAAAEAARPNEAPLPEAAPAYVPQEDEVLSRVVKMGRACAVDLAGQIGRGALPKDVARVLDSLERSGAIRRSKKDKNDPREYNEFQITYELVR